MSFTAILLSVLEKTWGIKELFSPLSPTPFHNPFSTLSYQLHLFPPMRFLNSPCIRHCSNYCDHRRFFPNRFQLALICSHGFKCSIIRIESVLVHNRLLIKPFFLRSFNRPLLCAKRLSCASLLTCWQFFIAICFVEQDVHQGVDS